MKINTSFRLQEETKKRVDDIAIKTGSTQSATINFLVELGILKFQEIRKA